MVIAFCFERGSHCVLEDGIGWLFVVDICVWIVIFDSEADLFDLDLIYS